MTMFLRLCRLLALACAIGSIPLSSYSQVAPTTKLASDTFLFGCEFPTGASPEVRKLFWETGSNFARLTGGGYGWALDSHKKAMEALDAHDVKVLLQLGSHYPDSRYFALKDGYFIDQAGETGKEDRNAYAITYSGQAWPQYSYASDTFRTELTKDFTSYLDGLRSCRNAAGLLLHNEPGYFWVEGRVFDYNPQAIARFRKWLPTQHASIAELNNRWSTSYGSFDEVEPPRGAPPVKNIAAWMDWRRFNVSLMQDFLQWEASFAHHVRPDLPCTTNLSGPLDNWYPLRLGDNYRFSSAMDIAGIDIYPTASWSTRFQPGFSMDMSMGAAQGRPVWVPECDVYDGARFPSLTEEQRAQILRSEIWSFIGHGARAVLLWSLSNQDGFALTHGEFNARVGAVREIAHTAQMLHLGEFHKPSHTTAICVDQDAFLYYGGLKPKLEGGGMVQQSVQGLYAALAEAHIETDIISADQVRSGALKKYRALLLATPALMDAGVAAQLKAFVAGGGLLIAEAPFAERNRWGRELGSAPGFDLDGVFGLHTVSGESGSQAASSISTAGGKIAAAGQYHVTLAGAAAIGAFADGRPAITRNQFGKGTAIYIGSDVGLGYSDGGSENSHLGAVVSSLLRRYSTVLPTAIISQDDHSFVDTTKLVDNRGNQLLVFVSPSERAHAISTVSGICFSIDDPGAPTTVLAFPPATQVNGRTNAGPQVLPTRQTGAHKREMSLPAIVSALPVLIARDSTPLLAIDAPMAAAPNAEVEIKATCFNPSPKLVAGTMHLVLPGGWTETGGPHALRVPAYGCADIELRAQTGMGSERCVVKAAFDYTDSKLGNQHVVSVPVDVAEAKLAKASAAQPGSAPTTVRLPTLQRLDHDYLIRLHEEVAALALKQTHVSLQTGLSDYRCVIHAHSYLSHDSRGTVAEIAAAAKQENVDAVFLTNHPKKDEDVVTAGQTSPVDDVLFVAGAEANGFLVFPSDGKLPALNVSEQMLVTSVARKSGQIFIAHPEGHTDWSLQELTGTEVYNTHADFEDEKELIAALRPKDAKGFVRLLQILDGFREYPQESFSALFDAPTDNLRRYDALCSSGVCAATAGNDSHQNTGFVLRGASDGKIDIEDALGEKIGVLDTVKTPQLLALFGKPEPGREMMRRILDPYAASFHYVSTHVLATEKSLDAFMAALHGGRTYVAFDWIADPTGTGFVALVGSKRRTIGDAIKLEPGLKLQAEVPVPGTLKLMRNGVCIATAMGRTLSAPVTSPGVYRLEVSVPLGVEQRPWIYTGAILVQAR